MTREKEVWFVPHQGMWNFVGREDDMLRLMKSRSEHVAKSMILFVECKGRG